MKVFNKMSLGLIVLFLSANLNAQHGYEADEDFSPAYILLTTMHWNADYVIDFDEWKQTEQEYFDKVTSKNKHILGAGVYTHMITPDDSEVIFSTVYSSLAGMEKAEEESYKLIDKAWPNEEEREAYFEKQSSFYTGVHSDEIVTSLPFQKDLVSNSTAPLVYWVRKNKTGNAGSGYKEFFDNIIMKNEYVKGYYTHKHRFGPNSTDATEIAVFENLADFEAAFIENDRLVNEYWSDKNEQEVFFKEFGKIFSGHGDFIYQNVPDLSK